MSRRSRASIYRYAGGIPTDESFNGKFRDECLSLQWFRNRIDSKVGIEQWRQHDNEERPLPAHKLATKIFGRRAVLGV